MLDAASDGGAVIGNPSGAARDKVVIGTGAGSGRKPRQNGVRLPGSRRQAGALSKKAEEPTTGRGGRAPVELAAEDFCDPNVGGSGGELRSSRGAVGDIARVGRGTGNP